jgi:hypothetical protein
MKVTDQDVVTSPTPLDEDAQTFLDHGDQETMIEAAITKTFERLYALVKKGYRPDLEDDFTGAIWLEHRCKHPLLFLYPSGLVVSSGKSDDFRFYRDEEDEPKFQKFLLGAAAAMRPSHHAAAETCIFAFLPSACLTPSSHLRTASL